MSFSTLYIIGNGFDLHHGIPSSYKDFRDYLEERRSDVCDYLEEFLHANDDEFWKDFERNLAELDVDAVCEYASDYLVGYGADDWSDSYHHSYQQEIDRIVSALSSQLLAEFTEWVVQLPPAQNTQLLALGRNALFLNFNYTSTLQDLYSIPDEQVFHLHGRASKSKNIILGHSWKPNPIEIHGGYDDPENIDTRVYEGQKIIEGYFSNTFKPTSEVLARHQKLFSSLNGIENIYILGHSLGDVDLPYFYEISSHIDLNNVSWTISWFDDLDSIRAQVDDIGIPSRNVKYISLAELESK